VEESVKAKWDKNKKSLRISLDVVPKDEEKLELPFKKIDYEGIDEDDVEIQDQD